MCPSAAWNSEGAQVFGVVGGDVKRPQVMFLKTLLTPSKELESKLGDVSPDQVFRVAAPCAGTGCGHHNAETKRCSLVEKIVEGVDAVVDHYAVCRIRATCLWWDQEGVKACVRCPQIATRNIITGEQLAKAADPTRQAGARTGEQHA